MNWGYSTIKDQFVAFTKCMDLTKFPPSRTKFNRSFQKFCNLLHYYVDEGQYTLICFPKCNWQKQKEDPKSK